jgi:cytochrome P450
MEQRKLMLPAFHGERMERLTGLMESVAGAEVGAWNGASELELHPKMQRLTMEIILRAVFGLDPGERLDALRDRLSRLAAYGDKPITLLGQPPEWMEPALNRLGPVAGFLDLRAEIDELLFEQISERRADPGERDDVLSILLDARHEDETPMSQQELRDELLTLLIAGHETTATTLAWAFERLVRAPDVLARVVAEIDADDGDDYLIATIRETLRRRPVLPNNAPRLVAKPIEVGGWHYEPGVCLVPNAYLVHHDPDVYSDPYAFRPERWLDQSPGTYTWIPFGGGRRRCLGASFALLEMQIVLRQVLGAYELRPVAGGPELARRRNITVRPGGGSTVGVGAREARVPVAA